MSQRTEDLKLLRELVDTHHEALTDVEVEAFAGMRFDLTRPMGFDELTDKQRAWVKKTHERFVPSYSNEWSAGKVPRGREVPTPAVLQKLPMKPPPMPKSEPRIQRSNKRHCGKTDDGCYAFVNGDCSCGCCR